MMRKIGFWLVGMVLLCGMGSSRAATTTTASGPANVLVVFNLGNDFSIDLASHYQATRGIPDANMLGLTTPASWGPQTNDTIDEGDYYSYLYNPVSAKIAALTTAGARIDYVVICRNLPYKIAYTSTDSLGNIFTDYASVDGAFMSPLGSPLYQVTNDFYKSTTTFADFKANNPLSLSFLVTRLDGWSWADASQLVDSAVTPRLLNAAVFLNVAIGQDTVDKGVDKPYNDDLRAAATALSAAKVPTQLATAHFTRPSAPASSYVIWGKGYDPSFSQTTFNKISIAPGALGRIIGSASASDLRAVPAHPGNVDTQFGTLIAEGITGGIAYIQFDDGAEHPQYMLENYFINGWNLADSIYSSLGDYGWQDIVIGDPLCTYLGPGFAAPNVDTSMHTSAAVGGFDGWHTAPPATDEDFSTRVTSDSSIGGTGSWINGGGGGTSGTSHGW